LLLLASPNLRSEPGINTDDAADQGIWTKL